MQLGPNQSLIGSRDFANRLATPALLVDLDALERNIREMTSLAARFGRQQRPHVKAHKSSLIGRRQLDAGAVGLCCATIREAEAMAAAGLSGLLITAPVVTPSSVARLAQVRAQIDALMVVVESDMAIDALTACMKTDRPVDVLIDIDMGMGRTGLTEPSEAVRLANRVVKAPQLRYRGIQAYYGHLQHVPTLAERHAKVTEQWRRLSGFIDALQAVGLKPDIVSGGGTGTHHLDLEFGPFTEIQPGSYIFMDKQYGAIELAPGGSPFETALTVAARVVSVVQPDRVIIDAGFKAMATDAGPPLIASGVGSEATYQFFGDEHGALRFADHAGRPRLGDLIRLVSPHCDPTVNLHNQLHVVQGGCLVDVWPIEARGY
ncbi:MAG: DSD1 family PLP-dependent enzyme [Dongiaceae bacterium]